MKAKFVPIVAIIVAAMATLLFFGGQKAAASLNLFSSPTPASTGTPGKPDVVPAPTSVPLAQPLVSEEQVLEQALRVDATVSVWDHPWSLDTMKSEPGRITIEKFPSRTAESNGGQFSPQLDADAGPVWRITIKGGVRVMMLGIGANSNAKYDGVIYTISQRTGHLLGISTGKPIESSSVSTPSSNSTPASSPYP